MPSNQLFPYDDEEMNLNDPELKDAMDRIVNANKGNQYINSPADPLGSTGMDLDSLLSYNAPQAPQMPAAPPEPAYNNFDDSVQKAVTKANQVPRAVVPVMPEVATGNAPQPSMEDDEMKQALQDQRKNQAMLAMLQGANTIGSSLAGTARDSQYTQSLDELAKAPAQDIKALRTSLRDKMTLDEEKAMHDPKSQASEMQRKTMNDMLKKIGYAPLPDNMSAKQVQGLLGNINIQNLMTQYESMQNRRELQEMKQAQLKDAAAGKLDDKDTKRLDQANKLITASIQKNNTAFGRGANIVRSAEAIENLVAGMDPKDIDKRQVYEIASSLDAMLSSGASTVSGREHLIPKSFTKDAAGIAEYITSRPQGVGQQAFIKRMLETVEREKELAKHQVKTESKKMLSSYADIQKRNPEIWNLMLQQHDLNPDLFKEPTEDSKHQASPAASTSAPQSDMVKVQLPDGRTGMIPRKNLAAAKAKGAKEMQ